MTLEEAKELVGECKRRRTVPLADFLTRKFEPKHGTDARWDECDCEDCHRARPYPRNCTLSPEEILDAVGEGAIGSNNLPAYWKSIKLGDITFARRGGRWFWTESKTAFAAGLYDEAHDVWPVLGNTAAGLDRVVEHWARVAEMAKIAAAVASSLKDARAWASSHANKMAAMLDNVSATDMQRLRLIESRNLLVDIDRLIRIYEAQADGSKP